VNLPRKERILPCTPDQRVCKRCGKETVVIGYEESSQLDVEPALKSFYACDTEG
jgi:transposase